MKKDSFIEGYCPYCKRHCSLNNPHCNKGKNLAKKKSELKKKENKKDKFENKKKVGPAVSDEKLLFLFLQCLNYIEPKKGGKKRKKRYRIISLLMEKGYMTKEELKEKTAYDEKELDKILHKMKKKGYINWEQEELSDKISITDSALLSWQSKQSKQDNVSFLALNQGEKEYLEKLLSKLYTSWKQN